MTKLKIVCRHCDESVLAFNVDKHNRTCASLNLKLGLIRAEFKEREQFASAIAAEGMRGYAA
jgi:hypothetical protein